MQGRPMLLLDAMGVIYRVGDDVGDLLIPFIAEHGGSCDRDRISALYVEASLGRVSPAAFWKEVGISDVLEAAYLDRFELTPGMADFLAVAPGRFAAIGCLSNDVGPWSRRLREKFELTQAISTWIISGDVGVRKPSAEIYRLAAQALQAAPQDIIFIDDRPHNLDAARVFGMRTVLFCTTPCVPTCTHRIARTPAELLALAESA